MRLLLLAEMIARIRHFDFGDFGAGELLERKDGSSAHIERREARPALIYHDYQPRVAPV